MSGFDQSLAKTLAHEGGYSNLKADPGGATMRGVTQAVYDTYRRSMGLPLRPVRQIETHEIQSIYRTRYWSLVKADSLPAGVGYVVFDGAVNSGVGRSVKWLQRALGIPADGVVGPQTIEAAKNHHDHDALVDRICDIRLAFLKSLKTWPVFGKGWANRVASVRATGKEWASSAPYAPAPAVATDMSPKAYADDVATAPPVAAGDVATGGGTVAAIISQTIGQLTPFQTSPSVANIIMWMTIAGAALAVGGIVYRLWAKRKADKLRDAMS